MLGYSIDIRIFHRLATSSVIVVGCGTSAFMVWSFFVAERVWLVLSRADRGLDVSRLDVVRGGVIRRTPLPASIIVLLLLLIASIGRLQAHPGVPAGPHRVRA